MDKLSIEEVIEHYDRIRRDLHRKEHNNFQPERPPIESVVRMCADTMRSYMNNPDRQDR